MISHKQTTSKPPVGPHKQTNKQGRRTNRPCDSRVSDDQSQLGTEISAASLNCIQGCVLVLACMSAHHPPLRLQACKHTLLVGVCAPVCAVARLPRHMCAFASERVSECACVGCNPSQSGTTQQHVQRPVCIITACPAAQDRQTRLRALSCKTQTSHPIAETPVARPSPTLWLRNGQTNAYK